MTNGMTNGIRLRRPDTNVTNECDFVQCVHRSVRCAVAIPNPHSIVEVLRFILTR